MASYLGMLLRNVLFGELCQLNQLRENILLLIAVGAIDQGAGYCIQDSLILRLLTKSKWQHIRSTVVNYNVGKRIRSIFDYTYILLALC